MRIRIAQFAEQNSILEKYISGADSNWQDRKKQDFFANRIAPLRQSYSNQSSAMEHLAALLEQAERDIMSLM